MRFQCLFFYLNVSSIQIPNVFFFRYFFRYCCFYPIGFRHTNFPRQMHGNSTTFNSGIFISLRLGIHLCAGKKTTVRFQSFSNGNFHERRVSGCYRPMCVLSNQSNTKYMTHLVCEDANFPLWWGSTVCSYLYDNKNSRHIFQNFSI